VGDRVPNLLTILALIAAVVVLCSRRLKIPPKATSWWTAGPGQGVFLIDQVDDVEAPSFAEIRREIPPGLEAARSCRTGPTGARPPARC